MLPSLNCQPDTTYSRLGRESQWGIVQTRSAYGHVCEGLSCLLLRWEDPSLCGQCHGLAWLRNCVRVKKARCVQATSIVSTFISLPSTVAVMWLAAWLPALTSLNEGLWSGVVSQIGLSSLLLFCCQGYGTEGKWEGWFWARVHLRTCMRFSLCESFCTWLLSYSLRRDLMKCLLIYPCAVKSLDPCHFRDNLAPEYWKSNHYSFWLNLRKADRWWKLRVPTVCQD